MATSAAVPKTEENVIEKIEGGLKKVWTVIEIAGKDAEKGLAAVEPYLPEAESLAAIFFPKEVAATAGVVNSITLIQNAVLEIKAKSALLPKGLTNEQMIADELALVGPTVTSLLTKEGVSADNTLITNIINAVVAILKVRTAVAA